jgi:hypothetical protein
MIPSHGAARRRQPVFLIIAIAATAKNIWPQAGMRANAVLLARAM